MKAVVYYSNSNQSYKIAKYLSEKSTFQLLELRYSDNYIFNDLILVFPVYCQNIPLEVQEFIKKIKVDNISLIATYGRKSFGNVVYEASNLNSLNIISYAYVPTKHTYIDNDVCFEDYEKLDVIVEKFENPNKIKIKKYFKNPFANVLMLKRSQSNCKIIKTSLCNSCNLCNNSCSNINVGEVNKSCIRCLKCVGNCPSKALIVKKSFILKLYLKVINKNKLIVKV